MNLIGADPLTQFLLRAAIRPFIWGDWDCLLWLAEWIKETRHVDPGVGFRGSYDSMLGAARIVRLYDGMANLVDVGVKPYGIEYTTEPRRGDIAVVGVAGDGGENFGNLAGGILLSGSVALLCQVGLMVPRLENVSIVAAWRL